ncbi:MAG: histidinol-phosphate transaminase [Bacteroidales bacterium]|nr:histidinol-phosphate transaminase [Bacteroidales bacterium]
MQNPSKYIRPCIRALEPYSTARDDFKGGIDISIWVDANENPYPTGVNRYPDPHQRRLKEAIAKLKGVKPENIFIGGAGSDEAIDLTYRIFCEPRVDNAIAIAPSYGVYQVAAAVNDVELRAVALRPDYSLPVEELLGAADEYTKLMWLCSPNNPTANAFPHEQILELARRFDGMVVVDEAYVDFSTEGSLLPHLASYPNLIILQTFSKAWGMASLRVGMAFSAPEISEIYARVKYPYNLNGPTQEEVIRRLHTDIRPMVNEIISERLRMERELPGLPCVVKVYPSDANFLLVKVTDADNLYDYLLSHGVIVRNRSRVKGCESTLRFTIGTPEENTRILSLLKDYPNNDKTSSSAT